MAIIADYHLHSSFSGDSEEPMEKMILSAIDRGLTHICFTEHMDIDFPENEDCPAGFFTVNTDSYLYDLAKYKAKYADQLKILFGVELGLQPHLKKEPALYTRSHEFDFIIGSTHLVERIDPYHQAYFEGRNDEEAFRAYFKEVLKNIKSFQGFDVCGHLDYVVRYGKNKDANYSYDKYKDIFDEILTFLIENEKGIELNTGNLRSGTKDVSPCTEVLRRYRELGGEIITVGSDAHKAADMAYAFDRAADILKACGFRYYCIFENRLPEYFKL